MLYYLISGCVGIVFFVGVCYWATNFFIKQNSERAFLRFRYQVAKETDLAIKLFREGLCEQIVQQENKSDSLAKLYATLIDLLQLGKDFTSGLGKGSPEVVGRKVQNMRDLCDVFAATYKKQSLHFSEELCAMLDGFVVEQQGVVQYFEMNWNLTHKDAAGNEKRDAEIRKNWATFEDHITSLMETLRAEFRRRQPAGNVMMEWLRHAGAPGAAASLESPESPFEDSWKE